jgi:hypothetical protein
LSVISIYIPCRHFITHFLDTGNSLWTPETQTIADKGIVSGTWQTFPSNVPDSPNTVDSIIVKGGNNFSVHQYDPVAYSGEWNVGYLPDAGGSGTPPKFHI